MARSVQFLLPNQVFKDLRYVAMAQQRIEQEALQHSYAYYSHLLRLSETVRGYLESLPEVIPESTWTQNTGLPEIFWDLPKHAARVM